MSKKELTEQYENLMKEAEKLKVKIDALPEKGLVLPSSILDRILISDNGKLCVCESGNYLSAEAVGTGAVYIRFCTKSSPYNQFNKVTDELVAMYGTVGECASGELFVEEEDIARIHSGMYIHVSTGIRDNDNCIAAVMHEEGGIYTNDIHEDTPGIIIKSKKIE